MKLQQFIVDDYLGTQWHWRTYKTQKNDPYKALQNIDQETKFIQINVYIWKSK